MIQFFMSIIDNENGVQYLLQIMNQTGAACATVKDGHVILLNKNTLNHLMKQMEDSSKNHVVLFIKNNVIEKEEKN